MEIDQISLYFGQNRLGLTFPERTIKMDKTILKAWDENQAKVREWIANTKQGTFSYKALLENTLRILFQDEEECPDYNRITQIDTGWGRGTLIFVIGAKIEWPKIGDHWYTFIDYGSCSVCDTLKYIRYGDYSDDNDVAKLITDILPSEGQTRQYWTLCLHLIQGMKRMTSEED